MGHFFYCIERRGEVEEGVKRETVRESDIQSVCVCMCYQGEWKVWCVSV